MKSLIPAAVVVTALIALSLAGCERPAPVTSAEDAAVAVDPPPPGATTGAGGAATASVDPNPAGAGAVTGADPEATTSEMGATSPMAVNPSGAVPPAPPPTLPPN
ncbi:hypothetical protein [Phenylobacterium kunshanense]|uniref:Uncharacterized protein n=1 Tax=Phenylobacterium kunshanense TaxID=1445034 RepID=A0A328BC35_9CAUL|nr:hypothetical protein [Phenylobacterium kunshanense]RAK64882.1 hypothetical protein DJ019_12790 [Phenylobacterium kunshanense]